MIFNGKVSYRIAKTDSAADDTMLIPETQEVDFHDEENATVLLKILKFLRNTNVAVTTIYQLS